MPPWTVRQQRVDLESPDDIALADRMKRGREQIIAELQKLIIGQDDVVNQVLLTLFVGGNSLIVGVPGLAKTLLIHTLAQVLDLKFNRIQFTPDLMPSDITGTDIIQEDPTTGRRQMVFAPGPIFANIVLADEINRTPPKTQSALLEAMQEHRVTIQGRTYKLDEPFFVFATQNPIELEGTYPLPEAQLDRFMFHIVIEHPPEDEEFEVVRDDDGDHRSAVRAAGDRRRSGRVPAAGAPRAGGRAGDALRAAPRAHEPAEVAERARSRSRSGWRSAPASARRSTWCSARKARALTSGRYHVSFDDIRAHGASGAAPPRADQLPRRSRKAITTDTMIDELLEAVPVPRVGNVEARDHASSSPTSEVEQYEWHTTARIPGARFVDPEGARADRQPRAAGADTSSTASSTACTARRTSARRSTSPSIAATCAGDDIRRVDWRLYARTDRYYVKQYEADTNTNFSVLLDVSKSMEFGSRGVTEARVRAATSARASTYLAHRQRDRVGIITFDNDIVDARAAVGEALRRRAAHARSAEGRAARAACAAPLHKMAEHFKRRGILVLISDFYEEPDAILEAIKPLRFLGNDLIVFHVLDPAEIDFGFDDASSFEDLESGEQMPVVPESLARASTAR